MRSKIVFVSAVADTLKFFRGYASYFKEKKWELVFCCQHGPNLEDFATSEGAKALPLKITREINPISDLYAVIALARALRLETPLIVHCHSPKGGLLGMLAAVVANVPVRVYHLHGFPVLTSNGLTRFLLLSSDWLTCHLSTSVIAVGEGVRKFALMNRLTSSGRVKVLLNGTAAGVDCQGRFNPALFPDSLRHVTRRSLGLTGDQKVVGYIGRIAEDKGLDYLATVWAGVQSACPEAILLIVGAPDERDPVSAATQARLKSLKNVLFLGYAENVAPILAVINVLVLPSIREGFGYVLLEAGAMEVPSVAWDIPGCREAIEDNNTGKLVEFKNTDLFEKAVLEYLTNEVLRRCHGRNGRARVEALFPLEKMRAVLFEEYIMELAKRCSTAVL
jgi:glycosyltransferase involved in cell wall biosynthesis